MIVIRGDRPENNFTIISNTVLRDASLSFRARGVLSFVLSFPDGFRISSDRLSESGKEGRDAIRACFNELEVAGYLSRVKRQNDRGLWETEVVITDEPATENPASDNRRLKNRRLENRQSDNPALNTKDLSNKTDLSKDRSKRKKSSPDKFNANAYLSALGVEDVLIADWLSVRKAKRLVSTKTAFDGVVDEVNKAGIPVSDAIKICCVNGWGSFRASWYANLMDKKSNSGSGGKYDPYASGAVGVAGGAQ